MLLPYQLGLWRVELSSACQACRFLPKTVGYLCEACDNDMCWLPEPFYITLDNGEQLPIAYATSYTGVMRDAVAGFKAGNTATIPIVVQALKKLAEIMPTEAVILPVPTTANRLRERGFYPVGLLARYLSAFTGLPIYEGVVRQKDSIHQRLLGREDRLTNLDGAFAVRYVPPSDTIIILDDVATTGSTLKSLADTLYQACGDGLDIGAVCLAHGNGN